MDFFTGEASCGVGEEVNGEDDSIGVASVGAEIACLLCSGADYYGVEVFFEFSGADRVFGLAVSGDDVYAAAESDAFGFHNRDAAVDELLFEFHVRDAVSEESAGLFVAFEDGDVVPALV